MPITSPCALRKFRFMLGLRRPLMYGSARKRLTAICTALVLVHASVMGSVVACRPQDSMAPGTHVATTPTSSNTAPASCDHDATPAPRHEQAPHCPGMVLCVGSCAVAATVRLERAAIVAVATLNSSMAIGAPVCPTFPPEPPPPRA